MGAPKLSEEETSLIDELQKQGKEPKQILDKLQRDTYQTTIKQLTNNYQTIRKKLIVLHMC